MGDHSERALTCRHYQFACVRYTTVFVTVNVGVIYLFGVHSVKAIVMEVVLLA